MPRRFQDIWKDQCEAAEGIAAVHGKVDALEYLIGEKLDNYVQAAATRPEFARELPRFGAAVRQIFSTDDITAYLRPSRRTRVYPTRGRTPWNWRKAGC